MSDLQLTETRIRNGVWHGILSGGEGVPQIDVRHLDQDVPNVAVEEIEGGWDLRIPIPQAAISEGVQTFVIADRISGDVLGDFTLIAGEALGDDIRAEVELLRAELDMLKRAFRRHCVETS